MKLIYIFSLLLAAVLEVGGDAIVRHGLKKEYPFTILSGMLVLGLYGLVVNVSKVDFSKLLGVYVAVFAVVAVLTGRYIFSETIPETTWWGLLLIVLGGLIIQFGDK